MTDFKFLKEVEEVQETANNGKLIFKRLFYASSYQGGILLRTTTAFRTHDPRNKTFQQISENIINIPMGEIYQKEDGSSDIRITDRLFSF